MTGAVTVAALVGLLSLLGGVALGWYLRRTNEWCPACGEEMACGECSPFWAPTRLNSRTP